MVHPRLIFAPKIKNNNEYNKNQRYKESRGCYHVSQGNGHHYHPDMTQEEIDDMIRSEIGLDFNIPERPMFDYSKIKIPEDTECSETHAAPTPNGGAYSTAYYYDANHMPCKKEEARYRNIVEYSEFGERINETYGIIAR